MPPLLNPICVASHNWPLTRRGEKGEKVKMMVRRKKMGGTFVFFFRCWAEIFFCECFWSTKRHRTGVGVRGFSLKCIHGTVLKQGISSPSNSISYPALLSRWLSFSRWDMDSFPPLGCWNHPRVLLDSRTPEEVVNFVEDLFGRLGTNHPSLGPWLGVFTTYDHGNTSWETSATLNIFMFQQFHHEWWGYFEACHWWQVWLSHGWLFHLQGALIIGRCWCTSGNLSSEALRKWRADFIQHVATVLHGICLKKKQFVMSSAVGWSLGPCLLFFSRSFVSKHRVFPHHLP